MVRDRQSNPSESGAVAIIVALSMTILIGCLALVADIGYLYEMRRQLQSAADAAALAGMQDKLVGKADTDILETAGRFAVANDTIGQPRDLEMLRTTPLTEITEDYVKVTVRKETDLFFAPLLQLLAGGNAGDGVRNVSAQAKAKRVFVVGGRGLMPWGVNTIRATDIEANVNGGTYDLNFSSSSGNWQSNLPVPVTPGIYPIDLNILNSQSFPQLFPGVGSINVHAAGDKISDAYLSNNVLSPGQTTYLYIVSHNGTPKADITGGSTYNEAAFALVDTNVYRASITAPTITETLQTFAVNVSVGNGANAFKINNAARLIVRNNNSPIEDVDFGPLHFASGGGQTSIAVTMRNFTYGNSYDLKIVADPETGNFNALDFRYIYHPPAYTGNHGQNDSAADYYENLASAYPGEVHIGDIITTKTGNLSGPQTTAALDQRINGCALTFAQWESDGKPVDCERLIVVPIVERIERMTGQSDVIVVAIAEFFLEAYAKVDNNKINISGRFVRYPRLGTTSDTRPDNDFFIESVRLEKPDF